MSRGELVVGFGGCVTAMVKSTWQRKGVTLPRLGHGGKLASAQLFSMGMHLWSPELPCKELAYPEATMLERPH